MRAKLGSHVKHKSVANTSDALELLKNIKGIVFSFHNQTYRVHSLHDAKRWFYVMHQEKQA